MWPILNQFCGVLDRRRAFRHHNTGYLNSLLENYHPLLTNLLNNLCFIPNVKQYMTRFRLKLAAILLSTGFNIRRGRPLFPSNDDDKPGSPNDVVEIENPEKQSTTSIKRKRDRDGDIISYQLNKPLHRIIVMEITF